MAVTGGACARTSGATTPGERLGRLPSSRTQSHRDSKTQPPVETTMTEFTPGPAHLLHLREHKADSGARST